MVLTEKDMFRLFVRDRCRSPNYYLVKAIGARRVRLLGMPWFKVFTSRAWREFRIGGRHIGYRLTEASTGLSLDGSQYNRALAIGMGSYQLERRSRRGVLGLLAAKRAGLHGKKRTKRYTYRSL
jgi:hypothetical protein